MTGDTVTFVSPCYRSAENINHLCESLLCQDDPNWRLILVDDCSRDGTADEITRAVSSDASGRMSAVINSERKHALRNVVEVSRTVEDGVVATLDGDDSLCNPAAVSILRAAYQRGADVVWTAHVWDTNGLNISRPMPERVDPYSWPWCSSHLRTFRASLLSDVPDSNFMDWRGSWFKRGYDQALMLPLLSLTSRRVYLPTVCYRYNIDSKSIPLEERDWSERDQLSTVNFVRARGFLKT